MGRALFYHLTRRPLERALPPLLARARAAGLRVVVRGRAAETMARLDELLWLDPEDGFLAHGLDGAGNEAAQPVLLTTAPGRANGAGCVVAIEGADAPPEEAAGLERLCLVFNGHDEGELARARAQWRALTVAGLRAEYWSEESGRWRLLRESG